MPDQDKTKNTACKTTKTTCPICPICNSKDTTKKGMKKNKNQSLQRYKCKKCSLTFTQNQIKNITYPIKIILNSITTYNLGHTLQKTSSLINKRYNTNISPQTISSWIHKYKPICTYHRLRDNAIKVFKPKNLIFKKTFFHIQPYTFKYHKAKLELLTKSPLYNNKSTNNSKFYNPIKSYLELIPTNKYPHHIFKDKDQKNKEIDMDKDNSHEFNKIPNKNNEQRASQLKFPHLEINKTSKNNLANTLTKLALNLAKSNKDRHSVIQNFMLTNDSTTIAVEVPVYLTSNDLKYFKSRNFKLSIEDPKTPITGHIDILQIRNGLIHILDYKPNTNQKHVQNQAIQQLIIYALALASRTKLPISYFKCAWFDENNFYDFFPLQAVYLKKK